MDVMKSTLIVLALASAFALVACGPTDRTGPGMPPSDQLLGKDSNSNSGAPPTNPAASPGAAPTATPTATPDPTATTAPTPGAAPNASATAPLPTDRQSEPQTNDSAPDPAPSNPPTESTAPSTTKPSSPPEPASPTQDQGTYNLKYNLKPGTEAKFRQESYMQMVAPMMSKDGKPVEINTRTDQLMKVTKATGAAFTVETTILDSKVLGSGDKEGMGTMVAGQMTQVKGTKTSANYTPLGKPTSAAGAAPSTDQMLNDFGRALGFQGLVFPGKPVKVGDSWNSVVSLDRAMGALAKTMGGSAKMDSIPVKTTFVKVEQAGNKKVGVFNIVMAGRPKMSATGGKAGSLGMQLNINSKGEIKIDLASGLIINSNVTVENSFTFSGAGMGQANGMKMSQLVKISTTRL